jgi:YxiJ-like protein
MYANEKLAPHFKALGDDNDFFTSDLNTYVMCIQGIASRFLHGEEAGTPKTAVQWLARGDFFTIFPKYRFLEGEWEHYAYFAHEYISTKRMQELELALLLTEDELMALKKQNPTDGWGSFLGPVRYISCDIDADVL